MAIRDNVIEAIANSVKERDNRIKEESYYGAIELGIENTFAALYDANVNDEEILRVVCKYWEIPRQDAENRLANEKPNVVIQNLKHYMKSQGYRAIKILEFFQEHDVSNKIRHNNEFWELKDNPKRLFEIIQGHK